MGYDAASLLVALSRQPSGAGAHDPARPNLDALGGNGRESVCRGAGAAHATVEPGSAHPLALTTRSMPTSPENAPEPAEALAARALVARIGQGDAQAESELVQRYSRGLAYFLRRSTGDPSLAEDLHQETFRIVLQRLRGEGLEQPDRLAGFIRRTARNLFLADYRRAARRRTGELDDSSVLPDPAPGPLAHVLQHERVQLVRRLVGELRTDRDRQILYRYYLAEEDKEHICRDLGLSAVHFNRVLFRARERFRELIERVNQPAAPAPAGGRQ